MTTTNEDENAFARTLFAPDDDGEQTLRNLLASNDDQVLDDKQKQRAADDDGADDGLDVQRRFAADLFAPDDPDANVLAGLTDGKTVGRTTPPRPEPVDKGRWFDRRPAIDD